MNFDKSSATHQWDAARQGGLINQLCYYKKVDGKWWVFSPITGWRPSQNSKKWFTTEREEGYFRKLTKEEKNGLAKAN
jgi:hypothetical protein